MSLCNHIAITDLVTRNLKKPLSWTRNEKRFAAATKRSHDQIIMKLRICYLYSTPLIIIIIIKWNEVAILACLFAHIYIFIKILLCVFDPCYLFQLDYILVSTHWKKYTNSIIIICQITHTHTHSLTGSQFTSILYN